MRAIGKNHLVSKQFGLYLIYYVLYRVFQPDDQFKETPINPLHLILLALIAFIFFKLWSILGTRNEDEPAAPQQQRPKSQEKSHLRIVPNEAETDHATIEGRGMVIVRQAMPDFDEASFLDGAARAYEMILQSFAKEDISFLQDLLTPHACEGFAEAIKARQAAGQKMETEIAKLLKHNIDDAWVKDATVHIIVRYRAEIMSCLLDAQGNLCEGETRTPQLSEDLWTFECPLAASNTSWKLSATESVALS